MGVCYRGRRKPCWGCFLGYSRVIYHSTYVGIVLDPLFLKPQYFWRAPPKSDKVWSQRQRVTYYFTIKTLSATPIPWYRWKAETLSFLHVLLVYGNILTILLIKKRQNGAFVMRYYFWRNRQKIDSKRHHHGEGVGWMVLAGNVAVLDVVRSLFWRHGVMSSRHVGPTRPTCRRHHVMSGSFFLCRMSCRYLIADMSW